jgi:8-oxo-dGTP pyrophosphatase MutT (NUDIX family)
MLSNINMKKRPSIISDHKVYQGAAFNVYDRVIDLGGSEIRRQVLHHAPVVVMLVHDVKEDTYLIEREYRSGSNAFAFGLPAGFIDDGESVIEAALRELQEETGVVPVDYDISQVGSFYSSEGMTDELAHIMIVDLNDFHVGSTQFDKDEYVTSEWMPLGRVLMLPIKSSNCIIALQAEQLRKHSRTDIYASDAEAVLSAMAHGDGERLVRKNIPSELETMMRSHGVNAQQRKSIIEALGAQVPVFIHDSIAAGGVPRSTDGVIMTIERAAFVTVSAIIDKVLHELEPSLKGYHVNYGMWQECAEDLISMVQKGASKTLSGFGNSSLAKEDAELESSYVRQLLSKKYI